MDRVKGIKVKVEISITEITVAILVILAFWMGTIDLFIALLIVIICMGENMIIDECEDKKDKKEKHGRKEKHGKGGINEYTTTH